MGKRQYQLFDRLRDEDYAALKADIEKRGIMIPVEKDSDGNILDGHHRAEIADELGIDCPVKVRKFKTEAEKREHVIKINMARRHLEPYEWGLAFKRLLEERGVVRGKGGDRKSKATIALDSVESLATELGVPERTAKHRLSQADKFETFPKKTRDAVRNREIKLSDAIRDTKKVALVANLESVASKQVKEAQGVYDVIVIDPPWPMEKIERDVRPNQSVMDYPTMTEAEMAALSIPAAKDCHIWVWTTHKFLPMALRLLDKWGMSYVCTFVWHKPGGFQPIGLPQYNCEFALYARIGTPQFIDTKAFPVCFDAGRGKHSEKPEEFYDIVRRVTAGRRLDMFNRREIAGFDSWGKEAQ